MKVTTIYFLLIPITFLFSNSISAQSSADSLKKSYSEKLIGTWVGQNEFVDKGGSKKDTITYTNDTLILSADHTFYLSRGSNTEKHWAGEVSTGLWEISLDPVTYIKFIAKYNNRTLSLWDYYFTILTVSETELNFLYDDKSYVYKRLR